MQPPPPIASRVGGKCKHGRVAQAPLPRRLAHEAGEAASGHRPKASPMITPACRVRAFPSPASGTGVSITGRPGGPAVRTAGGGRRCAAPAANGAAPSDTDAAAEPAAGPAAVTASARAGAASAVAATDIAAPVAVAAGIAALAAVAADTGVPEAAADAFAVAAGPASRRQPQWPTGRRMRASALRRMAGPMRRPTPRPPTTTSGGRPLCRPPQCSPRY